MIIFNTPHLYAITAGQYNKKSLLFHTKIEADFHTLKINKTNKKSVNMKCNEYGCKATHKFEVDEKFIKCIPDGLQMGKGKTRDKYYLDIENPELRDVTNWRVVPHNSKPHKPNEKSDFFTHIRREFRETQTENSYKKINAYKK